MREDREVLGKASAHAKLKKGPIDPFQSGRGTVFGPRKLSVEERQLDES